MLHLLYILFFVVIAFLAINNLIRNLITLGAESRRYPPAGYGRSYSGVGGYSRSKKALHPELLDESGKPIDEPLLVMRSVTVDDARKQLDALYNASPSKRPEGEE